MHIANQKALYCLWSQGSVPKKLSTSAKSSPWTYLTNHAHVLTLLARDPTTTMRDVANAVGITERAVQRIVAELEKALVLKRSREGRRNVYSVDPTLPLRHSLERHCTVDDLLKLVNESPSQDR
jgi:DNA-binding MarR family transcriptional regulator